jgi:hypothetical protein
MVYYATPENLEPPNTDWHVMLQKTSHDKPICITTFHGNAWSDVTGLNARKWAAALNKGPWL